MAFGQASRFQSNVFSPVRSHDLAASVHERECRDDLDMNRSLLTPADFQGLRSTGTTLVAVYRKGVAEQSYHRLKGALERVSNRYPANGRRRLAGMIPDGGLRGSFHRARGAVVPSC